MGEHLSRVRARIEEADRAGLLFADRAGILDGLSGLKTVGALQRLTEMFTGDPSACYLEIGVFQGLTLLSVSAGLPTMPCYGVDNFSMLDPKSENLSIVRQRIDKLGVSNAHLVNMDYEDALESVPTLIGSRKIAVYFIDGAHDYRSQLMCLLLALPHLHERAVILIDDSNYRHVRQSTRDFLISHPEFKLLFEAYSPAHPANLNPVELRKWEGEWLNGINIIVRDPANSLKPMYPPTERSRLIYENEHLIHRLQLAELAPEAVRLAQALIDKAPRDAVSARQAELENRHRELTPLFAGRFADRNTYSHDLPARRFNR